jgi:hypothetical protein
LSRWGISNCGRCERLAGLADSCDR